MHNDISPHPYITHESAHQGNPNNVVTSTHGRVFSIVSKMPEEIMDAEEDQEINKKYIFQQSGRTYKVAYAFLKKSDRVPRVYHSHKLGTPAYHLDGAGFDCHNNIDCSICILGEQGGKINCGYLVFPHKFDPNRTTKIFYISDIISGGIGKGVGHELWDIAEHIAKQKGCDFIIGHLVAYNIEDQSRLENAKRRRGYQVDQNGNSVLFLTENAQEKYRFLHTDSKEKQAYEDRLRAN